MKIWLNLFYGIRIRHILVMNKSKAYKLFLRTVRKIFEMAIVKLFQRFENFSEDSVAFLIGDVIIYNEHIFKMDNGDTVLFNSSEFRDDERSLN